MTTNDIILSGSVADVAQREGRDIAESFLAVDAVIIVDVSYSMNTRDSRGGRRRYDVALEELQTLQQHLPGKLAVVAFSDTVQFCPGGQPPFLGGGTNLAEALRFCRVADTIPGMRFVVVSDGEPNNEPAALEVARDYANRIDTVFVGPERDPRGQDFLRRLAQISGGQPVTADRVMQLADKVTTLLLGAGR